jgi:sugar phosphate isomerase/epimerase
MKNKIHVHIPINKVDRYLPKIKEYKLNLEIYFTSDALDTINQEDLKRLLETLDYKPSLSIHAPFMELSPGARDSKVQAVTLERFTHALEIAEMLSASHIVFHSGYEKWNYDHNMNVWLEKSIKTWQKVIELSKNLDLNIAIENIFEDTPTNLELLMKELYSPKFGICFDTGHFNIFSTIGLDDWMTVLAPYIIELHLHDNDKTLDAHYPIGEGSFDFKKLFSHIKNNDCLYTIETRTPEMVLRSIEKLKTYSKS